VSGLLERARTYIAAAVGDLRGDNDFMPFMTYVAHDDTVGFAGLAAMGEQAERDGLADSMIGMLAVNRAREALFASCVWHVQAASREALGGKMPSECENRVEQVFVLHVDPDGNDHFHFANIHRIGGRVTLGLWRHELAVKGAGGRFGEALHIGIRMGRDMPPEMVAFIDAHMEHNFDQMMSSIVKAIGKHRRGESFDVQFLKG